MGILPTTVHRIWRDHKLKPHQVRSAQVRYNRAGLSRTCAEDELSNRRPPSGRFMLGVAALLSIAVGLDIAPDGLPNWTGEGRSPNRLRSHGIKCPCPRPFAASWLASSQRSSQRASLFQHWDRAPNRTVTTGPPAGPRRRVAARGVIGTWCGAAHHDIELLRPSG